MDKIYFDLDGVMANFEKALAQELGLHYWDRVGGEKFWDKLYHTDQFFYKLDVMPGAIDMFNMVMDAHGTDKVEVLTAVPLPTYNLKTAQGDKIRWVQELVHPSVKVNCVVGGKNKYKWLEQHPGSLLIDDYARNIAGWIDAGGVGILHTDPESTIEKLKILKVI
jgi:hypothetical protein